MINSLQGLRTLAMIGIFLFHAGLLINGTFPLFSFLYYQDLYYIGHIVVVLSKLILVKLYLGSRIE